MDLLLLHSSLALVIFESKLFSNLDFELRDLHANFSYFFFVAQPSFMVLQVYVAELVVFLASWIPLNHLWDPYSYQFYYLWAII